MATTMAASHGIERRCRACGVTYRYPPALRFTCLNPACGQVQDWGSTVVEELRGQSVQLIVGEPLMPIDLGKLRRALASMGSDQVRQLHDRLHLLLMADEANRWRLEDEERFNEVRSLLASAGVEA